MNATETLERRIDELCAQNEQLRQENQSIGMAAYEIGYKNGSVHYELEHCPACKNIADLQEALAENKRLRNLLRDVYVLHRNGLDCTECPWFDECNTAGGCPWLGIFANRMCELGLVTLKKEA